MAQNPKRIIGRMAVRLFSLPVDEYLVSEGFLRFLLESDLDDIWKESLDLSRDRPDLYGSDVMKNALVEFLYHAFYRRPEEFPVLFSRFLAGFSQKTRLVPLQDLKKDLQDLGYPAEGLEKVFPDMTGNPGTKNRPDTCRA
jgi:hypothetical protein